MTVDAYLKQGFTHEVCQDYILHDKHNDISAIILSDGCSSEMNTDIGSRLLAWNFRKTLFSISFDGIVNRNPYIDYLPIAALSVKDTEDIVTSLQLNSGSVAATTIAMITNGTKTIVFKYGDGFIITKSKDGKIKVEATSFPDETPLYPFYLANQRLYEQYLKIVPYKIITDYGITSESEWTDKTCDFDSNNVNIYNNEEYEFIAIASDGLWSFVNRSKGNEPIDISEYIFDMVDYKGFNGKFVQRRMNKFIHTMNEKGYQNYDDISIGTIKF